jgi:hypothetical protein
MTFNPTNPTPTVKPDLKDAENLLPKINPSTVMMSGIITLTPKLTMY